MAIGLAIAYSGNSNLAGTGTLVIGVITFLFAIIISAAIKIADSGKKLWSCG